ncbi:MAG: hypothetical protein Q4C79_08030 [Neisseria sp.]|uniref:hypothetical protein n=1 Tax=Neisseria sp. TaxID=192066 RepID=UPI0026DD8C4E|nr:hypothetical protein [Neisseria sp.]MDO4248886.1 hypothetical protein [Neisseria sp.]
MKNLLANVLCELSLVFDSRDPKTILLTGMDDVKKYAGHLKKLDVEDRKLLTEYILRTEINKSRGQFTADDYNITVGDAIEKQRLIEQPH